MQDGGQQGRGVPCAGAWCLGWVGWREAARPSAGMRCVAEPLSPGPPGQARAARAGGGGGVGAWAPLGGGACPPPPPPGGQGSAGAALTAWRHAPGWAAGCCLCILICMLETLLGLPGGRLIDRTTASSAWPAGRCRAACCGTCPTAPPSVLHTYTCCWSSYRSATLLPALRPEVLAPASGCNTRSTSSLCAMSAAKLMPVNKPCGSPGRQPAGAA